MYKITKRFFSLLEVMIAIMIVVLTAAPLIAPYNFMAKASSEMISQIEADRIASLVFMDYLGKYLRKEIDLTSNTREILSNERILELGNIKTFPYTASYEVFPLKGRYLFRLTFSDKTSHLTFDMVFDENV